MREVVWFSDPICDAKMPLRKVSPFQKETNVEPKKLGGFFWLQIFFSGFQGGDILGAKCSFSVVCCLGHTLR